jgi:UDP-glucose-4-epimerase GalE
MGSAILVTGGAGYIGSHVCKALHQSGFLPIVYDNLSHGHADAVRWGPLIKGELSDRDRLVATMLKHDVRAVMHFAAWIEVGHSMREPLLFFRNNVANSIELVQAMVEVAIPTIVFSSTCAVYGMPERLPLDEDHPVAPVSVYGETKLMIEQVLRWAAPIHNIRYAALRYFNAAGADPDGEIGEDHEPETHLIPLILQVASGDRPVIDIFGTDWGTEDGTCIRDYVHVTDLADAHILALKHLMQGGPCLILNLGTGTGHSVHRVISVAETVTGRSIPRRVAVRRTGDSPILVAHARRSISTLGWRPKMSDIETIIRTAWHWHCINHSSRAEK